MLEILAPVRPPLNRVFAPSLVRIHLLVRQRGAVIGVERGKIQKFQIPNSKIQRNPKLQVPNPESRVPNQRCDECSPVRNSLDLRSPPFEDSELGFFLSLDFGIWS